MSNDPHQHHPQPKIEQHKAAAPEFSGAAFRHVHQLQADQPWTAGYNIVALPLVAGALANWGVNLSTVVGTLLMSISTIVVAINAQLLRRIQFV